MVEGVSHYASAHWSVETRRRGGQEGRRGGGRGRRGGEGRGEGGGSIALCQCPLECRDTPGGKNRAGLHTQQESTVVVAVIVVHV